MRNLRTLLALAAVFLLTACAVNPHPFVGPNGKQAYSMRCSGLGRTLDDCYEKAGELCPGGYYIVDRSSDIVGTPVNGSMVIAPRNNLAIECK